MDISTHNLLFHPDIYSLNFAYSLYLGLWIRFIGYKHHHNKKIFFSLPIFSDFSHILFCKTHYVKNRHHRCPLFSLIKFLNQKVVIYQQTIFFSLLSSFQSSHMHVHFLYLLIQISPTCTIALIIIQRHLFSHIDRYTCKLAPYDSTRCTYAVHFPPFLSFFKRFSISYFSITEPVACQSNFPS